MKQLIIGIDLCNQYTQISCMEEDKVWTLPSVLCRMKQEDKWFVGEEAYAHTLVGDGIIVDKLLDLVMKDGTATLAGIRYPARELLEHFLKEALEFPEQEYGSMNIEQLVITTHHLSQKLIDTLLLCTDKLGIERKRVHILSHSESFIYYILSQKKEVWNNQVGLFDLAEDGLRYYEMKVQRGLKRTLVIAEYENLEEGFNLDILETNSGSRLADKILCSCAERLIQKKLFSAMFLTGKGFEHQEWAEDFMKLICAKRRVYIEQALFAKGAAYKAADYRNQKSSYPFICICEGRLKHTVSIPVQHKGQENTLVLAAAGDNWYEVKSAVDVILDNQDYVEFLVTPLDVRKKKLIKILLEGFPERPNRTTKAEIEVTFLDEKTVNIVIKDKGFGELFPATDAVICQEVML